MGHGRNHFNGDRRRLAYQTMSATSLQQAIEPLVGGFAFGFGEVVRGVGGGELEAPGATGGSFEPPVFSKITGERSLSPLVQLSPITTVVIFAGPFH